MEKKQNEFKFSALRQFGSENISFTATIYSDEKFLSDEEIQKGVHQVDALIKEAFAGVQNREISEKALLVEAAETRTAAVRSLDEALKEEMRVSDAAKITMRKAEKKSK